MSDRAMSEADFFNIVVLENAGRRRVVEPALESVIPQFPSRRVQKAFHMPSNKGWRLIRHPTVGNNRHGDNSQSGDDSHGGEDDHGGDDDVIVHKQMFTIPTAREDDPVELSSSSER
jgi:hypothetical protein